MKLLLVNLMTASLAVHAVLGCCWHHDHDAADAGCQWQTADLAGSISVHAAGEGCGLECGETCRFLPDGQRFQLDRPAASPVAAIIPSGHDATTLTCAAVESQGLPAPGRRAELPVRRHLAHQLLLI